MSDQKRLFHEVLSKKLATAPVGITSALSDSKAAELMTILAVLKESKMKAADAHEIAANHAALPEMLASAGVHPDIVRFAFEVLDDLRGREDEKNQEPQEGAPSRLPPDEIHPDD